MRCGKGSRKLLLYITCRKNKQKHFHDLFNKSNESKDLWFAYKQLTSANYKSTKIDQLLVNDELTNCPKKISQAIAESVIIIPETLDNLEIPRLSSSEVITPIFPLEVNRTIRRMKPKKSPGMSDIPTHIIKDFPDELSPILSVLFNNSLEMGKFPSQWKTALVTPLFKVGGTKTDPNCYRPISVLPFFSKVYEHILTHRLTTICTNKKLISESQFGFRNKHSTFHALTHLTQKIYDTLEKRNYTLVLYFDLVRAFDSISHKLLIDKLRNTYHLPEYLIVLISDYLKDRYIRIKLGNFVSDSFPLYASVPQGSKIGPILFNLYVHDGVDQLEGHKGVFADDIAALAAHKNFNTLLKIAIEKIEMLHAWCNLKSMKINWTKNHFSIFRNSRTKKIPYIDSLKTETFEISRVSEFKYLGVWLDEELRFDVHASKIINKITPRIHYLLKPKRKIPAKKFHLIFNAIVMSCLEYGIQIWAGSSSTTLARVQKVVDNCLKSWVSPRIIDINLQYEMFNLLRLDEYPNYYLSLFAKSFTNNLKIDIPKLLQNFVTIHDSVHETRSRTCFIIPPHKTVLFEKSVKYRLIKFWNGLPNEIKDENNPNTFKSLLTTYILKNRCKF